MHILWLASWYPNKIEHTNGDFVQRHAIAVSKLVPIHLIHVVQSGKNKSTQEEIIQTQKGNLTEQVISFSFSKWRISILDKIRYNIKFIIQYRKVLLQYEQQYGKPDLIHVHIPMKAGILAMEFSRLWQIPFIVTEHSSLYDPIAIDTFSKRSFYFKSNTKKIFKTATAVTNVSAAMGKRVDQLFYPKRSSVINNVVDTQQFFYQPKASSDLFRWIHVSSLYQVKNAEKIIEAFKLLARERQDWELIIIGAADQQLVDSVYEAGLYHRIKFFGEMPHSEIAAQMQAASALVLFSKHENFPCVIIEALCCGLPVVSSDVGGIAEAVNASNGILVETENIKALKNAFVTMMNQYQQFDQAEIAKQAASKYAESVIAQQFVELYSSVLHQ
jgi:glycosyltransferase involved in cell wall biosynthesis